MSFINSVFGKKAQTLHGSSLDGAPLVAKMPGVEIFVEGFDVSLSTKSKPGEYTLSVRSNGTNADYPAEEHAKILDLTKSESVYNLAKIPLARISCNHEYSRTAIGVVDRNSELREGDTSFARTELSVVIWIRDENGLEQLWSCGGIEQMLPPQPQPQPQPRRAGFTDYGV